MWTDKITNVEVRRRTGMDRLEDIIRKRRLQWLGHVQRMEQGRIPKQTLNWSPAGKRKRGRPRMNWTTTVKKDLEGIGMTWEETERAAADRVVRRSCVARCAEGTGRTKYVIIEWCNNLIFGKSAVTVFWLFTAECMLIWN